MEKQRKIKVISIIALIVAVLGLTVAFAALSETLTINGTASLDAATWDVHFENISSPTITGEASEVSPPEITDNGITLSGININLTKPKDSVKYTVDVVNDGTINAEIVNIVKGQMTAEQEKAIEFSVTNEDGTNLEEGFILNAKEKQKLVVTIKYKDDIEASDLLSKQSINLSLTLNYVQTDLSQDSGDSESGSSGNYGEETISWNLSDTVKMTYYNGELQEDGTYDNGTLVISGEGEIPGMTEDEEGNITDMPVHFKLADVSSFDELQWDEEYYVILKYNPSNLIIKDGITSIGEAAFLNIPSITNVDLANSVTELKDGALDLLNVTTIDLNNVEKIGNIWMSSLVELDLKNVKEIPGWAFEDCEALKIVKMPNITIIGEYAFYSCHSLSEVYITSKIETIGAGAFNHMASDSVIYVPDEETKSKIPSNSYDSTKTTIVVDPTKFE